MDFFNHKKIVNPKTGSSFVLLDNGTPVWDVLGETTHNSVTTQLKKYRQKYNTRHQLILAKLKKQKNIVLHQEKQIAELKEKNKALQEKAQVNIFYTTQFMAFAGFILLVVGLFLLTLVV